MRLKHLLSVFLTLLTLAVGNVWGALTNTYIKMTSATELDENAEYVIGNVDSYGCPTVIGGTGINTTEANWFRWNAANGENGFYLYSGSTYITVPSGNAWGSGTSSNKSLLTTNSEGIVTGVNGTTTRILVKNSSNAYLRWYNSGQTKAYLYKVVSSCDKKVTVTKSSASNGSYTLKAGSASGATIDNNGKVDNCDANATIVLIPSANTHYHVDEVTASNSTSISGPDASGNYTITYTKGSNISTTIGVTFEADPTYTVTWVAGSNSSFHTQTNYAGTSLTAPGTPDADLYCPGGKVFKGWTSSPIEGEGSAPADLFTSVSGKSIPVDGTTYYAVFATEQTGSKTTKTDNLTHTINGKSNTNTTYTAFTNKSYTSDAKYAGQSNNGNNNTIKGVIQLRCSIPAGIVSTTSGGKIKKVTVTWNSNTSAGRYVTIYGKNSAYTGSSDLYAENTRGTELGTIIKGTSTELTVDGSYEYIGILASNALYMTQVDIQWEVSTTTYSNYATTCCTPLGSIKGSFSRTNLLILSIPFLLLILFSLCQRSFLPFLKYLQLYYVEGAGWP